MGKRLLFMVMIGLLAAAGCDRDSADAPRDAAKAVEPSSRSANHPAAHQALPPTVEGAITSLDDLSAAPVDATVDDWDLRVAVTDSGLPGAPWHLLYVLATYTADDEHPRSPDFGQHCRLGACDGFGYDLNYAPKDLLFIEEMCLVKWLVVHELQSTTRRLYAAVLPTPLAGQYRVRLGPREGYVERIFEVTETPALNWTPLLVRKEHQYDGIQRELAVPDTDEVPAYLLADQFLPAAPEMPGRALWYADRGARHGTNADLYRLSLPGRAPFKRGWLQWPSFGDGRYEMLPQFVLKDQPLVISLADEGRTLRISRLEDLYALDERLLARWWINGELVVGELDGTKALEELQKAAKLVEQGHAVDVPLVLPAWLAKRVRPGDRVAVQVMSCLQWQQLNDPRDTVHGLRRAPRKKQSNPALSNRLEFDVTEAMLQTASLKSGDTPEH
jgi:hypothetical protein